MSRITIIIIWLIVIACLVAVGEVRADKMRTWEYHTNKDTQVGARLTLHALRPGSMTMLEGATMMLRRS